jgi:hypothetical protein
MTMTSIQNIWDVLKNSQGQGLFKRAYVSDIPFRIYGTYRKPSNIAGIAFSVNQDVVANVSPYKDMKDIKVSIIADALRTNVRMLIIELNNGTLSDIFSVLCDNLIYSVLKASDERQLIKRVLNQIEKWKQLFSRMSSSLLNKQEQQGLYGELFFLKEFITENPNSDTYDIIDSWVGSDKAKQDFQGSNWALEVKTTSTVSPSLLKINGERQLDDSTVDTLYLFHLSVDVSHGNSNTLPDLVDEIKLLLQNDLGVQNIFGQKLMEAGYFDKDEPEYRHSCYAIRSQNYYHVEKDFPRIVENDLKDGVGNVTYLISIEHCKNYLVNSDSVYKITSTL